MASKSTYIGYAQAAAGTLVQKWFPVNGPVDWVGSGDYWHVPNAMTSLTDLMQLTGTTTYMDTAANAKSAFYEYFDPNTPPQDRYMPSYYDDEAWWGSLFLRLSALTGDSSWATSANQIFLDLQAGWDNVAKGGVWWKRNPKTYPPNEKGSIENELYMDIAMGLYPNASDSKTYLGAATQTWQWMQLLLNAENGLIAGSLNQDGTVNKANVPRPYTQGVILRPLYALWQQSNDPSYLDVAQTIAQAAIINMTWPDGILQDACERDGNCGDSFDPILFKGVYVRYLGEFARGLAASGNTAYQTAAQGFATFLQANADALWANYPGGIFGMDWHTPSPNYQPHGNAVYDGSLQSQALDLFIAAAVISE